jgi:4a-hydroxytetrahydrobiopterin dehydratase
MEVEDLSGVESSRRHHLSSLIHGTHNAWPGFVHVGSTITTTTGGNMPDRKKLSEGEIAKALTSLRGWSLANGKLHKEFKFEDFTRAFGFMATVALIAEGLNHHPDWSNVYNRVIIDLNTHSEGGITGYDVEFATRVERVLG